MKIADFDNLIAANHLILIDFYASWCGACGAIDPMLDRIAFSMGDIVTIVRIDTTSPSSFDIVNRYNIVAVPTLILFRRSIPLWRESGIVAFNRLHDIVRYHHSMVAY